jgi:hypothetical protein
VGFSDHHPIHQFFTVDLFPGREFGGCNHHIHRRDQITVISIDCQANKIHAVDAGTAEKSKIYRSAKEIQG